MPREGPCADGRFFQSDGPEGAMVRLGFVHVRFLEAFMPAVPDPVFSVFQGTAERGRSLGQG
jgi:hypothetical protein